MSEVRPRIVVAGTQSGAGKTTIAVGLMAAFHRRGLVVQGYKTGPDFIDPSYHTAVTGRPSRNLDGYMFNEEVVQELFLRGSEGADLSIVEGVMGLYDGKDPLSNLGSTAQMSQLLQAPVLLCLDVSSMARSAAAVVLGFQQLDARVRIAGVIANRAGGEGHFQLVKAAVEQVCQVPVLGYLPDVPEIRMPERHLGLIPAIERGDMAQLFERLAQQLEATVDLDEILRIAEQAPAMTSPSHSVFPRALRQAASTDDGTESVVIAIAKDAAFNFYYPENLELLEACGAKLVYFSPLQGETIPDEAAGLYIGGGFPEEFAATLSDGKAVLDNFRHRMGAQGLPTFAECGGYMFLCRDITTREGHKYPMVGLLDASVNMQPKLAAIGYREVVAKENTVLLRKGESARGHEFHYSRMAVLDDSSMKERWAYEIHGFGGRTYEGYAHDNLLAGYTHLHFASNPNMARQFVERCRVFQRSQSKGVHPHKG